MRLAQWRMGQGWTQAELAEQLGVTQPAVSDMERAVDPTVPKAATMNRIYRLTGGQVQPNDFYDLPPVDSLALDEAA